MKEHENNIIIDIEDDGCGFDLDKVNNISDTSKGGFGLSIMYERIYLLSGLIDIKSKMNEGTKIHIEIPKKEE